MVAHHPHLPAPAPCGGHIRVLKLATANPWEPGPRWSSCAPSPWHEPGPEQVFRLSWHTDPTLRSPLPVCSGTHRVSLNAEPIVMGSSGSQALKEFYFLTSPIGTFNAWWLPGSSTALCHCLLWHCTQKDLVSQRGGQTNERLLLEAVPQETPV